ncbi:MAG TPA: SDR family oxidoreductase [Steroidobacteraceae bacterium]|jgi:NAD(P)-dependent dehydrogenase (short-subunit alcohol dehydrogenase family)|nr:SDR family oxidoreductase [Steroidobacteraceae bacterium]
MDLQLNGRLALITGSTAGIGRSIAGALAKEGAEVIVTGRASADVERAAAEISAGAPRKAHAFAGDLADAAVAARLVERFPKVEILVNNLGIYEAADFADISDDDWLRLFNVNVLSGVRLSRAYLPAMRAADWGRIIFISSESGLQIPVEMIHYGVTKSAQIALARGLAESVAGSGITVNSVLAGPTKSRGVDEFVTALARSQGVTFDAFEKDFFAKARPTSLIKRFATPEEVASLVAYVASPLASATTGAALRVDGGVVKSAF